MVSSGDISAQYEYLENSGLVGRIDYQYGGASRMKTTKTYDDIGNRKRAKVNGQQEDYEVNLLNQYKKASRMDRVTQPRYDADGNLMNDGQWQYSWDAENRLVGMDPVQGQGKRLEFAYDERGRRIGKKVYGWAADRWSLSLDQRFVYDGWNLVTIIDASANPMQSFVWGLDLSGSEQGAGGVGGLIAASPRENIAQFAAYDGNGIVVCLMDARTARCRPGMSMAPSGKSSGR